MTGDPVDTNTAQVSPRVASQKYSNELKFRAISARIGAVRTRAVVPTRPPMTEQTRPVPSARSASPRWVMR